MSDVFWMALALMLIFEGIMPFISPTSWKATMRKLAELSDRQIRIFGFCTLMGGLLIAMIARH